MVLDCSVVKNFDNRVLCDGLNQIIQSQDKILQLLSNLDFSTISNFLSSDSVYFFLGVVCAVVFIQGVKLKL